MNKRIIKDEEVSFIEIKNDKNLEVTLCTLGASFYRIVYKGKNRIMTPINHKEFYYNEQYYLIYHLTYNLLPCFYRFIYQFFYAIT